MVEVRVLSAYSQGCLFKKSQVAAFRQMKVQVDGQTGLCSRPLLWCCQGREPRVPVVRRLPPERKQHTSELKCAH